MNSFIKNVDEFHRSFNLPILDNPDIPSDDRCNLRVNLIQEELDELRTGIENKDIVEISDACGDLMVVLCGTILEFGLGDKFDEIYENIHQSNMSKACLTEQEAIETVNFYLERDGTEAYYKNLNNRYIVYRKSDNKLLKSVNYTPASVKKILNG